MKSFVEWVLARAYRPALVAVACAPLPLVGPFVTTALLVLVTAHHGLQFGVATALAGVLVLTAVSAIASTELALYAGGGALSMLLGTVIGALLRWARSLSLGFQSTLLLCFLATACVSLFGPPPETMFAPLIDWLVETVGEDASTEELQAIRATAPMMLGVIAVAICAQLVISLLIGYWGLSYAREDVAFGKAFRSLKLGRVLGIFGMVWVTLGLFVPLSVVQNLTPIALLGFLFQGLAVMHAWAHAKRVHPGLVAPVYVLFIPPVTGVTVMALSAVGLLDNVFDLRAPLRA